MLTPSIIYAITTILLALVDAIRIKRVWGKQPNITHTVSWQLAIWSGFGVYLWWVMPISLTWWLAIAIPLLALGFVAIRLALFDIFVNLFRQWTGTNPTGRIDYVSTETTSDVDQHSEKIPFWWKRIGGILVWLLMFLLYKVIFKV